ncbi:hypothetical protein B5807_01957 [Epicoccum nigrum]|uniref:Uncharacterized protein n=1 Tax=Epicoccum nigrum TaxID=105696 RepID=A0A1Y2M7U5_EPING|nr:hypothetical protein B5807_01957 [Epicoccum nigrum]
MKKKALGRCRCRPSECGGYHKFFLSFSLSFSSSSRRTAVPSSAAPAPSSPPLPAHRRFRRLGVHALVGGGEPIPYPAAVVQRAEQIVDTIRHPPAGDFLVGLGVAEAERVGHGAAAAVEAELDAGALALAQGAAVRERLPGLALLGRLGRGVVVRVVLGVDGHVVPVGDACADLGPHVRHEDVAVSQRDFVLLVPVLLEAPELVNLGRRHVMVCDGGVAPQITVDLHHRWVDGRGRVGLKVREGAVQRHLDVLKHLAQGAVADPVGLGELLVVVEVVGALLCHLGHGGVGQDEARAAVAEFYVVDVEVLADVVRLVVVEAGEVFHTSWTSCPSIVSSKSEKMTKWGTHRRVVLRCTGSFSRDSVAPVRSTTNTSSASSDCGQKISSRCRAAELEYR